MPVLSLSYYEIDDRITNISQSLPYKMAENSWHRYDMKKLRHCHRMCTPLAVVVLDDYITRLPHFAVRYDTDLPERSA